MLWNGVLRTVYSSPLIPGNLSEVGSVMSPCMLCADGEKEGKKRGGKKEREAFFLFPKHSCVYSVRVTPCSKFCMLKGTAYPKIDCILIKCVLQPA